MEIDQNFSGIGPREVCAVIDWNSDIVANPQEVQAEDHDALANYFGEQMNNPELFRSYEAMKQLVGEFKDVPLIKLAFARKENYRLRGKNKEKAP